MEHGFFAAAPGSRPRPRPRLRCGDGESAPFRDAIVGGIMPPWLPGDRYPTGVPGTDRKPMDAEGDAGAGYTKSSPHAPGGEVGAEPAPPRAAAAAAWGLVGGLATRLRASPAARAGDAVAAAAAAAVVAAGTRSHQASKIGPARGAKMTSRRRTGNGDAQRGEAPAAAAAAAGPAAGGSVQTIVTKICAKGRKEGATGKRKTRSYVAAGNERLDMA